MKSKLTRLTLWTAATVATLMAAAPVVAGSSAVLFVSNRDGNAQIYRMDADGSGQRALTRGAEENTEPAWSPDGSRIAFTSYRDGNAEICVMDADGANAKRLTSVPQADSAPAWTPDGRILFRSTRDRWSNFYRMDADGSNLVQLSSTATDKGAPVLSPDGRWIAFVAHAATSNSQIYVLPAAGGSAVDVTSALSKNQKFFPSWSPDSRRLAYVEAKSGGLNVRAIDPDGGHPVNITDDTAVNASPVWSPDGKRLAFVSNRDGTGLDRARGDIFVMNADGSGAVNLSRDPNENNYPAWAADGQAVYFVSLRDGTAQLYTVPALGGASRRLTQNKGNDLMIRPQALAEPKLGLAALVPTFTK